MKKKLLLVLVVAAFVVGGCISSPQKARDRGMAFYDLGDYPKAHPLLEKAFAGGMTEPELIVRLAFCRATVKSEIGSAIELLRDAVLKYPDYARLYYELGFIAFQYGPQDSAKNLRQAIEFTHIAVEKDTADWLFKDNLGMYYGLMGQLDSARIWLQAAQRLRPADSDLNARLEQLEQYLREKAAQDSTGESDTLKLSD